MTSISNQNQPFVIGVSGIAGAGKSTLIKHLSKILDATTLFWDDFDEISQGPEDYVKWYESSRNYDDWVYDDLVTTLKNLKAGHVVTCPTTKKKLQPTKFVLFDAPLGFCHKATAKHIDFLVCLDTPLDIALARRLLRDYQSAHNPEKKILEELEHYLLSSRPLFVLTPEERVCDLNIDGSLTVKEQCQRVLAALQRLEQSKKIRFEIKLQPLSNEFKRQIYAGFSRHAIAKIGHDEKFDAVAFIASNEKSSFIGAVVVELFWGALHVKYVYVEDEYRGCGIATKLMEHALSYGRDNRCPFAFVETMSFQALGFYEKMGFELEFTRSGYKHNTSFHYLRKNL